MTPHKGKWEEAPSSYSIKSNKMETEHPMYKI